MICNDDLCITFQIENLGCYNPVEPASEHDEREEGQYSTKHVDHEDSEDSNYLPTSEEDVSLGDEDFIVPEEPLEQERFK